MFDAASRAEQTSLHARSTICLILFKLRTFSIATKQTSLFRLTHRRPLSTAFLRFVIQPLQGDYRVHRKRMLTGHRKGFSMHAPHLILVDTDLIARLCLTTIHKSRCSLQHMPLTHLHGSVKIGWKESILRKQNPHLAQFEADRVSIGQGAEPLALKNVFSRRLTPFFSTKGFTKRGSIS